MRAETGPLQFGDDWPGVFIRGDNAMGFVQALRALLQGLEFSPPGSPAVPDAQRGWAIGSVGELVALLESSQIRRGGALPQGLEHVKSWEECQRGG